MVASAIAERFPVIIIDEAQDTSVNQMAVFDLLSKSGVKSMFLVGDADQSMAIFAAITDIPEFGMRGVDMQNGRVMTFAADQNERRGFRIITHDIQSLFVA